MNASEIIAKYPYLNSLWHISVRPDNAQYLEKDYNRVVESCRRKVLNGFSFESFKKDNFDKEDHPIEMLTDIWNTCQDKVVVGLGCTEILYSDSYACEVVEVENNKVGNPKRIGVRHCNYKIKDHYDGEGTLEDGLYGPVEYYTLRRGGGWYAEGQPKKRGSVYVVLGYQHTYLDPSF